VFEYFDGGSSQLYAIRCDVLRTPTVPRDEEERLLRTLICGAKEFYRRTEAASLLFVLRQVFTSFQETLSLVQPRLPLERIPASRDRSILGR
jgi:hypothetical protein